MDQKEFETYQKNPGHLTDGTTAEDQLMRMKRSLTRSCGVCSRTLSSLVAGNTVKSHIIDLPVRHHQPLPQLVLLFQVLLPDLEAFKHLPDVCLCYGLPEVESSIKSYYSKLLLEERQDSFLLDPDLPADPSTQVKKNRGAKGAEQNEDKTNQSSSKAAQFDGFKTKKLVGVVEDHSEAHYGGAEEDGNPEDQDHDALEVPEGGIKEAHVKGHKDVHNEVLVPEHNRPGDDRRVFQYFWNYLV